MEDDEEIVKLDTQFYAFSKLLEKRSDMDTLDTMTLYCSDYWMRQSHVIDDRRVTMTDTGVTWCKFNKSKLNWDEWREYLAEFCLVKGLNQLEVVEALTNCGPPGSVTVQIPQYKDFFKTYKSKNTLKICESLDSCGKQKKK